MGTRNISKERKSIYYKKEKGQHPRTLSLRDCVQKIFPNEKDPVRRNLERVCSLRDEATHLIFSQVPKDILALFQSCVLNYHKRLVEWFNISLLNRVSVGMVTIVYDFSPDEFDLQSPVLRRRLGRETARYLAKLQEEIRQEFENLGKPAEFSIDIDYKLALVKKPDIADIVLSSGNSGAPIGVVEVPKDPSKTHPHRQKEVITEVSAVLDGAGPINQYDIQCVIKVYDVRKRPEFYYRGAVQGSPSQVQQ
jgi:hypothetical protein